jgi:cytochrome P450
MSDQLRIQTMGKYILEFLDGMEDPMLFAATLAFGFRRVRDFVRAGIGQNGFRPRRVQRISDRLGAIEEMFSYEIQRRRKQPGDDILSLLVGIRFDDGAAMSDEELRDNLLLLLLAAYETTAATLGWATYCLLRHPQALAQLRAELRTVMPNGFDPSRVKELVYTGAVLNETMRLYPITTLVSRQLKHDTELAGHKLPAGTVVAPCIYLVQRDPRLWPQPTEFRPERFLVGKAPAYQFLPFGAGVWRCIGAQFAEYEMRVILARLVAQVDLELLDEQRIRPVHRGIIVVPSDGLPVRVRWSGATAPETQVPAFVAKEAV